MSDPITIAFVGHADHQGAPRAAMYEDDVLRLLPDHGAHLLFHGRRGAGQDADLPAELHLIWFPNRDAFEAFLADPARQALLEFHGDAFSKRQIVEVEPVVGPRPPPT